MLWFSIALVIIATEIVLTILYFNSRSKPKQEMSEKNDVLLDIEKLNERLKQLEDQVSTLKISQGMRRRE
jgi:uncharacterized protein YlxW (UPF0749 family)